MVTDRDSAEIQPILPYNTRSTSATAQASQNQPNQPSGPLAFLGPSRHQSQQFTMRTPQEVDNYVTKQWDNYQKWDLQDETLWETFREDFMDYNTGDWKMGSVGLIRQFRDYLRKRGVWIKRKSGYSVAAALTEILNEIIQTP